MAVAPDEHELWERYRADACRAAQEALFFRYAPWSRLVARDVYRRVRIPQLEWSDYTHNASIGLLEAMSRFDARRGLDFPAYAKPRVRGAVFNGLRIFLSDARHAPLPERRRERIESLEEHPGGEDALTRLVDLVTGIATGFMIEQDGFGSGLSAGADTALIVERHQLQDLARSSLDTLTVKERHVMELHYFSYLPFVEIAALLGLTKGRISQLHSAAIRKAAAHMAGLGISGREV